MRLGAQRRLVRAGQEAVNWAQRNSIRNTPVPVGVPWYMPLALFGAWTAVGV